MANQFATQNGFLLTKNGALSECCCETQPLYWEAIPCSANEIPRDSCTVYPGCSIDRVFVAPDVLCEGDNSVCECQKLTIRSWPTVFENSIASARLQMLSGFSMGSGIITNTSLTLSAKHSSNTIYSQVFNYADYNTFDELVNGVNAYNPNGFMFYMQNLNVHASSVADSINDGIFTFAGVGSTADLPNRPGNIAFMLDGQTSTYASFNSSTTVFAGNIETAINSISPGGASVIVTEDESNSVLFDPIFYITFQGLACGTAQSNITTKIRWIGDVGPPSYPPEMKYGDYVAGWSLENSNDYCVVPSGGAGIRCPYEDSTYNGIGYAAYNSSIQCCPQRGARIAANQIYPGVAGYGVNFQNLEKTFVTTDIAAGTTSCYTLSPFFFLFGKEGRFNDDPQIPQSIFYRPKCDYVTGDCSDHIEWANIPQNGQLELFIPQFSHFVPWGPFGSYRSGLEDKLHPAYQQYLIDGSYSSHQATINSTLGYHYSPRGSMRTMGSWTNTTGIILEFAFYSWAPFDMRATGSLNRFNGSLKESTLSSRFNILRRPCCDPDIADCVASGHSTWVLSYNPVGTSVQQFINDVNAIRIHTTSGIGTVGGMDNSVECALFDFCQMAGTGDLLSIPANKINNLSSQLYDAWLTHGSYNSSYLIDDPDRDRYGFSGSSIRPIPTKWNDKLSIDTYVDDQTKAYPNATSLPATLEKVLNPPNASRLNTLPYPTSFNSIIRYNCRPAWTTMAGGEVIALNIAKSSDPDYDPQFTSLSIEVVSPFLNIVVSSGATVLASTGWKTIRGTGIYTQVDLVNDLNSLTFKQASSSTTYHPIIATSGNPGYLIYIDDTSRASNQEFLDAGGLKWYEHISDDVFTATRSPGVGGPTSINYGYQEPLLSKAVTDITTGSVDLKSWVRFRSTSTSPLLCNHDFPKLLMPLYAKNINSPSRLNCDGDNYIQGNWLVTYGCNSYFCKTEWFIKAQRCSCTTVPACDGMGSLTYVNHPTNRDTSATCDILSTPRFYMCENNLHPNCTIPFLIKVPALFQCRQGQSCYYQMLPDGSCWSNPASPELCDVPICPYTDPNDLGSRDPLQIGFTNPFHGCPASYNVNFSCWMNESYDNWCQYIDPSNLQKVRKQDIPRAWPPEAYVVESTEIQFCTNFINVFDAGAGLTPVPPNCGDPYNGGNPYDAITPLWPWVPYEYIIPAGFTGAGQPCFIPGENKLYAYIRPIVKNYNASGLCGGSCSPLSIDCNTRCCHCGESCSLIACPDSNPQRGCTVTTVGTQNYNDTFPSACGAIGGGGRSCHEFALPFTCPTFGLVQCPCLDATVTLTRATTFSKTESTDIILGYKLVDSVCTPVIYNPGCCIANGTSTSTEDRGGGCGGVCWWNGCGDPPPDNCTFGTSPCSTSDIINLGCDFNLYADLGFTASESSHVVGTENTYPCSGAGQPTIYPYDYDVTLNRIYSTSSDACGAGTTSATETFTSINVYYFGSACNGYAECTCGSWDVPNGILFSGTTRAWTKSASSTIGSVSCGSCNFDSVGGTTDYDTIINYSMGFICGLASNVQINVEYPPVGLVHPDVEDWACSVSA